MHKLFKRGLALAAAFTMALPASMPVAAFAATTVETLGAATVIEDGASYRLISAVNTKLSATVASNSILPGTGIVNETDGHGEHHIFIAKENNDRTFKLITQNSDMALEVKDGSSANNAKIQTAYENDDKQQNWNLIANDDGSFTVQNAKGGTVLDVKGASKSAGTTIQAYAANGSTAQKFYFVKTSATPHIWSGFFTIRSSKNQNFVLDIAGGSLDNHANIQLYTANDTAAQTFRILYAGNGYYRIQGIKSFGVLDVEGYSTVNNANVQQYKWTGGSCQLWKIIDNGDGTVTFQNKKSSKVLDVAGGLMQNGRNIQQYESNGTEAQKWVLRPASRTIYPSRTPQTKSKVYVNAASIQVYTSKSTSSAVVATAYYGEHLTAVDGADSNGWCKVITTGGKTGYVNGTVIQSARPANRNVSNGYPLYYGDDTMNVTVLKEQVADTWVYAAHVQTTDYSRFKGAYPAGPVSLDYPSRETVLSAANRLDAILMINGDAAPYQNAIITDTNGNPVLTKAGKTQRARTCQSVRNGESRGWSTSVVHPSGGVHAAYSAKTGIFSTVRTFGLSTKPTAKQILDKGITETFVFEYGSEKDMAWLYKGENKRTDPNGKGDARTFIGSNEKPGDLWLCVCDGNDDIDYGLNSYEEMEYLKNKGCTYGYGLDGGGSSAMVFRGNILNPQDPREGNNGTGRAVWDFLYVK